MNHFIPPEPSTFEVAHLPRLEGMISPGDIALLNVYPSAIDRRSRVKTAKQWVETGHRAVSESSYIRAIRYHRFSRRLYLEFKRGGLGYYHEVPIRTAIEFFNAPSHGVFLHARLKGRLPWVTLRG